MGVLINIRGLLTVDAVVGEDTDKQEDLFTVSAAVSEDTNKQKGSLTVDAAVGTYLSSVPLSLRRLDLVLVLLSAPGTD